jgi:FAD/FMN-containing dehydrogenase
VRTEFGRFSRQVSGYSLEHLLPENGRRLDRFLVGSEGTLGLVTEATVRLVQEESQRLLLVLGYPSMVDAADAVPTLLSVGGGRLVACEGLDARIVDLVRARGRRCPSFPAGRVAVRRGDGDDAPSVAGRLAAAAGALGSRVVTDPAESAALWRIREDGAGLAGPQPAHARVLRLGGRGRPARAPRGVAARLRRAAA